MTTTTRNCCCGFHVARIAVRMLILSLLFVVMPINGWTTIVSSTPHGITTTTNVRAPASLLLQTSRPIVRHMLPCTRLWHAAGTSSSESQHDQQRDQQQQQRQQFKIRKCKYADLKAVSDIIVASFYEDKMKSSPFSAILKLGELNRLQQNFPYADQADRHVMFVATTTSSSSSSSTDDANDSKIIGFVDIDARPATRRIDPPRPYLSDLAVHPDYRRLGIATTLIQTCEELVSSGKLQVANAVPSSSSDGRDNNNEKVVYIRVEQSNAAAIQMYEKFQYHPQCHAIFGIDDTTVLLRKEFPP
jgi:ribosomal protein S18 acetylase RimI-like enzyme